MPKYEITAPNGKRYEVEAESQAKAMSGLKATLDAQKARGKNDFSTQAGRSYSLGAQDLVHAGTEALLSQAGRLVGKDPGYGLGEAFQASRRVEKQRADEYARDKPVRGLGAGIFGGLAMPGGAALAKLGTPVAKGLLGGLETVGRGAGIGGALGGIFGGLTEPDDAVGGAARGAGVGALAGGLVPAAAGTAGAVAKPVVRAANKALGGKMLNPTKEVSTRLGAALKRDGFDIAAIRDIKNQWLKTGVTPQLLDVVGINSHTGALLKGAASGGAGRKIASDYARDVRGNVQDHALDLTRKLLPGENRSAVKLGSELDDAIRASDDALYPKFQADQVATGEIGTSLSGDTGLSALKDARKLADARQDWNAVEEIDNLIRVRNDPEAVRGVRGPETVSAGTLDLIRRGLRDSGQAAFEGSQNTLGGGLRDRASELNTALLGVDGFQEATSASRNLRQQREAIDTGLAGRSTAPDVFEEQMRELPSDAAHAAKVGLRSRLMQDIGAPAEDATTILHRLGTARNQGRNLSSAFGPEEAQTYQGGLQNLTDQAANAKGVNPRPMVPEEGMGDQIPLGRWAAIASVANKLRNGATLTDAEREGILKAGLGDLSLDELEQLIRVKTKANAAPAVGYGATQFSLQNQGN